MDQQVKHVITLPRHLKSRLYPIDLSRLEELRALENFE